ncbi:MAG: glycerol-3-phosphate 1-O-acyltransferase PlsY [Elusimicrobiota bacterium]|jgi:glycerol-3-phosphate acyltransferase PlsY|nr:glycerol-3-phosphate 1-O-acyltransferase PlsY [Elusimicrobiota bacterium]
MLNKILYIIFAYFCGAIPFAYILTKLFAGVDIRTVGSGNPGTTNVFRAAGKKVGILVFLLDVSKGFVPVYFACLADGGFVFSAIVALAAMLGHIYTIFLKFKGGKGVATGLGVFLALMSAPTLSAFAVFIIVFLLFGYVSFGSISACIVLPIAAYFFGYGLEPIIFASIIAFAIIYKHKSNIKRLIAGNENKFNVFGRKNK